MQKFQGIVSVNDFLVSLPAPWTFGSSCVSPEKFSSYTDKIVSIEWQKTCTTTAYGVTVSVIHPPH